MKSLLQCHKQYIRHMQKITQNMTMEEWYEMLRWDKLYSQDKERKVCKYDCKNNAVKT